MQRVSKKWFPPDAQTEYPFLAHYFFSDAGKLHYIDEGEGEILLLIHGNPSWSFTYRKLIKSLSGKYRCIAVDLIGFGFSDKPSDWGYTPKEHADIIEKFIHRLGLKNITLVLNDWGGPIGMNYAVNHPENIKGFILFNTWMWSLKGNRYYEIFSGFMGSFLGKFLIRRFNFFARAVVTNAIGNKKNFPKNVRKLYSHHLETANERKGSWIFPKEIINSSAWLENIWAKKELIKDKPALLLWGMKDIAFRKDILEIWQGVLRNKDIIKFEDAGHFPQEEKSDECLMHIHPFLIQIGIPVS